MDEDLTTRVEKLEREARRWRLAAAIAAPACLAIGLLGAAPLAAKLEILRPDVVDAALSVNSPNFRSSAGPTAGDVSIHSSKEAGQVVSLHAPGGGEDLRAALVLDPEGTPSLNFQDGKGKPRLSLGLSAEGSPALQVMDRDGELAFGLGVDEEDGSLVVRDAEGGRVVLAPAAKKPAKSGPKKP